MGRLEKAWSGGLHCPLLHPSPRDTPPPLDEYEIDPRSDVKKLPGGNEKHVYYDRVAQTSLSIGQWSRSKWALLGMNTMASNGGRREGECVCV